MNPTHVFSCLTLLLVMTAQLGAAAAPEKPSAIGLQKDRLPLRPGDDVQTLRGALQRIQKAIDALPPGNDTDQLKQTLERLHKQLVASMKQRLATAEAEVAKLQERSTWSQRMVAKGFLAPAQAKADQDRLQDAEATLERLKREVHDLNAEPRKPAK